MKQLPASYHRVPIGLGGMLVLAIGWAVACFAGFIALCYLGGLCLAGFVSQKARAQFELESSML